MDKENDFHIDDDVDDEDAGEVDDNDNDGGNKGC